MAAGGIRASVDLPPTNPLRLLADDASEHASTLRAYVRSSFPSLDADDVVQESYLRLLRARAAGRIASTKAYLFTIARNTALTFLHRGRIYSDTPVNELPEWRVLDGGPDAAQAFAARERLELMTEAISQLPTRCREVMSRAVLLGQANSAIAAELGLSENTVRVHLARGIRKCAEFLRERGERA